VVPSPNRRHQHVVGRLVVLVFEHVRDHGGGEVFVAPFDAVLSDIDVFQPDIVFVSNADIAVLTDNIRGNPTWVIEGKGAFSNSDAGFVGLLEGNLVSISGA
jgi:hypothetical protein